MRPVSLLPISSHETFTKIRSDGQRSLPPDNLNTNPKAPNYPYNYHVYTVKKEFTVIGGPIRPWFDQPGLGTQFYTGANTTIKALVQAGFMEENDLNQIEPGPGPGGRCG